MGLRMTGAPQRPISIIDVRNGAAVRHARLGRERARALRDECLAWFPSVARPALPLLDRLARQWLRRSCSPYLGEIEAIAAELGYPGVWFLNSSYQWGCTTLAREDDGVPVMARTLDWPFPGLGRHVDLAHMQGPAGEFFGVTWPGYVGILTAMAPGRFAAAMNQAPLWRRTRHPWLRPYDLAANSIAAWAHVRHIPPDQLLRQVFETCATYAQARAMLETTPVARPVIFTLAGCVSGERCVIERTEEGCKTHQDRTCVANDWLDSAQGWEGRITADLVLRTSFADAAENSRARRQALSDWNRWSERDHFAWVTPPVLNRCTRLAVEMCPARGRLRVVGYELAPGAPLPEPATEVGEVGGERQAA
jgi:hypothetical protein